MNLKGFSEEPSMHTGAQEVLATGVTYARGRESYDIKGKGA